ncbi:MAG: hypothetical protein KKB59_18305 [Spirochaetes bacterium]|nr:hypothetical protein [Spirochaetota bacterium]
MDKDIPFSAGSVHVPAYQAEETKRYLHSIRLKVEEDLRNQRSADYALENATQDRIREIGTGKNGRMGELARIRHLRAILDKVEGQVKNVSTEEEQIIDMPGVGGLLS